MLFFCFPFIVDWSIWTIDSLTLILTKQNCCWLAIIWMNAYFGLKPHLQRGWDGELKLPILVY